MQYGKIDCKCGETARVVESGVGVYISCPYCLRTTAVYETKEKAVDEFLDTSEE